MPSSPGTRFDAYEGVSHRWAKVEWARCFVGTAAILAARLR